MRVGQKNPQARIWAKRGTRPRKPADQRYSNAYLFGAICPTLGKGAALVLPRADTEMMRWHLEENQPLHNARRSRRGADGPGWMAHYRKVGCSQKHYHHLAPITGTRTQPGRKHLAVPAR